MGSNRNLIKLASHESGATRKKFLVTRNFLTRIFDYIAKIEKDSQALFSMIVRVNLKRSWN